MSYLATDMKTAITLGFSGPFELQYKFYNIIASQNETYIPVTSIQCISLFSLDGATGPSLRLSEILLLL